MNVISTLRWRMLSALLAVGTTIGLIHRIAAQQPPQQPVPSAGQVQPEVLTRGPLHEAFAETITFDPEPGIVAPKAPPANIEEETPEHRPLGAHLTWIPGYWAWDDERNDFLWVSGIWRALPPGRQWVPGYWGQTRQGVQWSSGYWADAGATEIDYLPEPPVSVEAGPNVSAPSADDIWLPGSWIWQQDRYAWRAGYWTKGHQDWDWVPEHYVWTPSGYVFVDGYYDYSVPRRGIVFAPVYFDVGLRSQRGYSYTPATVINPAVFVSHLFLRPGYGHYYFGDYYSTNYANAGFSPWFAFQSSRRGYDPIYANQRWQHRQDSAWEQRAEANFRNLRDNENARPPRNWAAQTALTGRGVASNPLNTAVAEPLDELAKRTDAQLQLQPVNPAERQQFGQQGQAYRKYLQQREQLEASAARAPGDEPATASRAARRPLSKSPYVAPPADQLGKENAPPQRHQVLKPDLQVQPQPRTRGQSQPQRQGGNQGGNQGGRQGGNQGGNQGGRQGSRQGESASQSQGQAANGDSRQGASTDQQQGASRGQQRGASPAQSKNESKGKNEN